MTVFKTKGCAHDDLLLKSLRHINMHLSDAHFCSSVSGLPSSRLPYRIIPHLWNITEALLIIAQPIRWKLIKGNGAGRSECGWLFVSVCSSGFQRRCRCCWNIPHLLIPPVFVHSVYKIKAVTFGVNMLEAIMNTHPYVRYVTPQDSSITSGERDQKSAQHLWLLNADWVICAFGPPDAGCYSPPPSLLSLSKPCRDYGQTPCRRAICTSGGNRWRSGSTLSSLQCLQKGPIAERGGGRERDEQWRREKRKGERGGEKKNEDSRGLTHLLFGFFSREGISQRERLREHTRKTHGSSHATERHVSTVLFILLYTRAEPGLRVEAAARVDWYSLDILYWSCLQSVFNILVILTIGARVRAASGPSNVTSAPAVWFSRFFDSWVLFYINIMSSELATDDLHGGSQRLKMKMVRLPVKKNPQMSNRISSCVAGTVVGSLAVVMLRKYSNNNDLRYRNGVLYQLQSHQTTAVSHR